eukprot:12608-Pyramimonas_sp.AAC.2
MFQAVERLASIIKLQNYHTFSLFECRKYVMPKGLMPGETTPDEHIFLDDHNSSFPSDQRVPKGLRHLSVRRTSHLQVRGGCAGGLPHAQGPGHQGGGAVQAPLQEAHVPRDGRVHHGGDVHQPVLRAGAARLPAGQLPRGPGRRRPVGGAADAGRDGLGAQGAAGGAQRVRREVHHQAGEGSNRAFSFMQAQGTSHRARIRQRPRDGEKWGEKTVTRCSGILRSGVLRIVLARHER